MSNNSTNAPPPLPSEAEAAAHLLDDWFDPIEAGLRDRVREFIQAMIEGELEAAPKCIQVMQSSVFVMPGLVRDQVRP